MVFAKPWVPFSPSAWVENVQPDYADPASWFVRPGHSPFWAEPSTRPVADLFYIHPTTFISDKWTQPYPDSLTDDWTARSVITRQMSAIGPVCRSFAPRYRQASSRAYREPGENANAAYQCAYGDIKRAFAYYLKHENAGRPFILLGHSQGALHVGQVLDDFIDSCALQKQLMAAYAIGIGFSEALFGSRFKTITPCQSPDQTGCFISWNSFEVGGNSNIFLDRTKMRDSPWLAGASPGWPLCINPLSFDPAIPEVPAIQNPGSLLGEPGTMPVQPPVPGLVGARSQNGVLWVSPSPISAHGIAPLPGGSLHMHDIGLFYTALRYDAQRRCAAYAADAAQPCP